ncbi:MAG: nuclear transport factor 2 family protein [Bacteroidota bacterium]
MNTHHRSMIEAYVQAYNALDVEGMIKHLHEDVVFENSSNGEVDLRTEGRAAFEAQALKALTLFSQRQQTITSWESDADSIWIGIAYVGILAIDLPNGLKKGDELSLQGRSIFQFQNNQIILIRDES